MRIVLLGDSHLARVRRDLALVGPDVHNAAVGGATSRDLAGQAERADVAALADGDVVVVSVGTNDASPRKQVPVPSFVDHLRACWSSVPARRVYVAPPGVDEARLGGPADRTNRVIDDYRTAALAVCRELGVNVVPAEQVLAPLGADAFVDDGLHLTGRGYRLLLPAIAAGVRGATAGVRGR